MTLINIALIIFLVFMNGFFVAAEFAMVKVRKSKIEMQIVAGNKAAVYTKRIIDDLNSYLSACQLGITLASLGLGWIGEPAIASLISPLIALLNLPQPEITVHAISFIIAFSFITACHIVLGELVPKSLSIINAEKISLMTSRPLIGFYKLTYPIIWLFNKITNLILRLFGIKMSDSHDDVYSDDEIMLLMEDSLKHEMIDKTEYSYIENIFGFSEKKAREIMTPRMDMICIDITDTREQIQRLHLNEQMTRYPVFEEDKDNIIGFVNIKDLYTQMILDKEFSIKEIMRPVLFVPDSTSLSRLLQVLQREKSQMSVLIDEYGGTSGLVTAEDIMEEIVGSIQDEYDDEVDEVKILEKGVYLIDGDLSISDLNKVLDLNIDADGVDTVGGWIISQLQEMPDVDKSITYCNYTFSIFEMNAHRVETIKVVLEEL